MGGNLMTREQYIKHPATSASRIKRFYTGDISYAQTALDAGAAFHYQLLEQPFVNMPPPVQNVYTAINELPLLAQLFINSEKEYIKLGSVNVDGVEREAKGMFDLCWLSEGIIADVKTTSAGTIQAFAHDMIKHLNHVQAVWYSSLMGFDPALFFYIGIPPKVKQTGRFTDLYLYRHKPEEIEHAKQLISKYFQSL
jgi:hypothetical protein